MNRQPPHDEADELARHLERLHDDMMAGRDATQSADDLSELDHAGELASATEILGLIERVRDVQPSRQAGGRFGRETPADFSTQLEQLVSTPNDQELGGTLPRQIGRFRIRRQIGQGGHGLVFLAHDPRLDRDVALKIPRLEALMTDELRSRFLLEARAAASLRHPHIIPVFDAGQTGMVSYIATPFVDGESLAAWLTTNDKPVGHNAAAQLIATLADAMQHAHSQGVIHRDLKPSNVLLNRSDSQKPITEAELSATALITDFGLAKVVDDRTTETRTGAIVGTPAYMAPEQTGNGDSIGPGTDIYGLGAVLYEMLTGEPPFRNDSVIETVKAIQEVEPVPPRRHRSEVPRDLESICLKCLEKSPGDRYLAAQDLRVDLRRFLNGEPVIARPVTTLNRLAKFARRNRTLVTLTSIALLTLFIASVVSTLFGLSAAHQRRTAVRESERSRQAILRLFTTIARHPEFNSQGMESVKQSLLQEADLMYADLVGDLPGDDKLRLQRADSLYLLARVSRALGESKTASNYLRQAISDIELTRQADGAKATIQLAPYRSQLGALLYEQGLSSEAEQQFALACDSLRQLSDATPPNEIATRVLAESLTTYATAVATRQRPTQLLDLTSEALRRWSRLGYYPMAKKLGQLTTRVPGTTNAVDDDFRRLVQVANCIMMRGKAEAVNDKLAASLESTKTATTMFETLGDIGSDLDVKTNAASGWHQIGATLSQMSQFVDAETNYQHALRLYSELASTHPQVPHYQGKVVGVSYSLAFLQYITERYEEAEQTLLTNVQRTADLAARYPELRSQFFQSRGLSLQLLYGVYQKQGRQSLERDTLNEAIATFARIMSDMPDNLTAATALGNCYSNLAYHLVEIDDLPSAMLANQEAIDRLEQVLQIAPQHLEANRFLAGTYANVAEVHDQGQNWRQSLEAWELSVEYDSNPERINRLNANRVRLLIRLEQHDEAVAAARGLVESKQSHAEFDYFSAQQLAKSVTVLKSQTDLSVDYSQELVDELSEFALQLLRRSKEAGHFQSDESRQQLQGDETFEPIREHPGYLEHFSFRP